MCPNRRLNQAEKIVADTIIGSELIIDGNLRLAESARIDGRIEGAVDSENPLEIGLTGHISSDVRGERVAVSGKVEGNIEASVRVDLLAGAKLRGNVRAPRFTIADGASFSGKVDMEVEYDS